jgi:hypothetical protein
MTAIILPLPDREAKAFPQGYYAAVNALSRRSRGPEAPVRTERQVLADLRRFSNAAGAPHAEARRVPPHARGRTMDVTQALTAYAA